jgi:hypothetical protein
MRFEIPGEAPSLANARLHWAVKAKQVAKHRAKAMLKCPKWTEGALLVITLMRHGVRELDSDNLAAALKGHRDGVAARLRIDDGSPLVEWRYQQATCVKGEERVTVTVEAVHAVLGGVG